MLTPSPFPVLFTTRWDINDELNLDNCPQQGVLWVGDQGQGGEAGGAGTAQREQGEAGGMLWVPWGVDMRAMSGKWNNQSNGRSII